MSRNPSEDQTEKAVPSLLQSRPQRKENWQRSRILSIVLLGVAAAIIVGTGIVLAVVLTPRGPATSSSNNANSQPITNKQANSACGQGNLPPAYWNTLLQQTAQGLHLSAGQVKTQIKSGKSIQDVARAQGISAQQLLRIETSALQIANNQLVALKCATQAQANANIQYYTSRGAQDLNSRFTYWFTNQ